eukprot:gene18743-19732_t
MRFPEGHCRRLRRSLGPRSCPRATPRALLSASFFRELADRRRRVAAPPLAARRPAAAARAASARCGGTAGARCGGGGVRSGDASSCRCGCGCGRIGGCPVRRSAPAPTGIRRTAAAGGAAAEW